jgi:hypothetical protein
MNAFVTKLWRVGLWMWVALGFVAQIADWTGIRPLEPINLAHMGILSLAILVLTAEPK